MDLKTLRGHSNIKALGNLGTQRTRSLPLPKVCKKPTLPKPVPDVRYDLIDHFSEFIEKRVRCRFCPMENSYVICNKFRITLCFRKDQSCFYDFHHQGKIIRLTENFQIGLYTCSCQYFLSFWFLFEEKNSTAVKF